MFVVVSVGRLSCTVGNIRRINKAILKLKSLIMAQIERWRQA